MLRERVDISGRQYGFRKRMEKSDAIFIVRQIMQKHIEGYEDLCLNFVDLEKAYDWVQRKSSILGHERERGTKK